MKPTVRKNKTEKDIQKILNQLISEEWIASVMYKQFILAACCKEERHQIKDLLIEISDDEMDDHYEKLVKFAIHNGYSVPCKIKDYEKYASEKTTKQFNSWKENEKAGYYIQQAIDAEVEAISSYQKFLESEDIPYDLLSVLISNFYDEQDHLRKLLTLKTVYDSGSNYVYCC